MENGIKYLENSMLVSSLPSFHEGKDDTQTNILPESNIFNFTLSFSILIFPFFIYLLQNLPRKKNKNKISLCSR